MENTPFKTPEKFPETPVRPACPPPVQSGKIPPVVSPAAASYQSFTIQQAETSQGGNPQGNSQHAGNPQGGNFQGGYPQGGYPQNGPQGGYQGGYSQGGYPQGGYSQGGYQGGYSQGGYPQNFIPKSRTTYILLAIFLGGWGIHNFYAGYTKTAVIQLLLTFLTCGLGGLVSWIWAVVEAINVTHDGDGHPMLP